MEFESGILDTSRFQDADKYAAYLKTPAGRLRSELAWENMRRFLPRNASRCRALDVGGGTGFASVQLAQIGLEVVLLDGSEQMLRIARQNAEVCRVTAQISFCHADIGQLRELFAPESFDVVVCHNLLEYTDDPSTTVREMAHVLRKEGVLSVLVRNRAGEVLKEAVNSGDWKLAAANLIAETAVDTLYGERIRVFAPADLHDFLVRAGLEVVAEYGVRVFFDYLKLANLTDATYSQVFELESTLGVRPEYSAIARYVQVIARRSGASSNKVI
ncbi:MAG: methyltransferase domain-containing protein [Candidatus Acidiferrales bacterium]